MPPTNTASNKNQSLRPVWQTWGSTVNVTTSSETRTTSIEQESGAKPNMLAIGTASTMTPPPSSILSPYISSTQASTSRFKSCGVLFDKQHRPPDCLLISDEQRKRLMYLREVNVHVLKRQEALMHGETPLEYPEARRDYRNPNRNTSSSQTAKQPGEGNHQNRHPSENY